jgi:hypothetical protein
MTAHTTDEQLLEFERAILRKSFAFLRAASARSATKCFDFVSKTGLETLKTRTISLADPSDNATPQPRAAA